MDDKVLVFGHKNPDTDTICSSIIATKLAKHLGYDAEAVRLGKINKETEYVFNYLGIEPQREISKVDEGQKIILVDHNEEAQSVEGREKAEVIAVIDHHRIADFTTTMPLYYIAKPYGCTATVLFELYQQHNLEIDKEIGTLMLSAIISDTLLLKSPTCTEKDVEVYNKLEEMLEINAKEYGLNMLKAGTDISALTAKEVIDLDAKEFMEKGKKFVVAQVNTADISDVFSRKEDISFAMEKEIADKKLDLFVFVITDIINTNSKIIALGEDKELAEKAFGQELDEDDSMLLEGVVSRKKQIAPPLLENL
ncbi:MAG: manganese-dependent inorganic pyrophosphatase [Clostridia bacterium]|nr:manganese-dependent inorganic pyrophosphatase [Clostridia bacterium]